MDSAVDLGPAIGGVTLLGALVAGMVSFLSPCVLPLVPGYLAAVTGVTPSELEDTNWRKVLIPSLLFIAAFSTVFILLGLGATALGDTLRSNRRTLETVSGIMIIAMGVFFIATMFVVALNKEWRIDALVERAGSGGPLIAGFAFAIAWSPCVGPTLGAILTLAAPTGSASQGAVLLGVYSLGLAIPFIATALAFSKMSRAFEVIRRHYSVVIGVGGAILIVMGILVLSGELTRLNGEAQQALDSLGINIFSEF